MFTQQIIAHLKILFEKICQDFEAQLIEIDGEIDHVHLLINYPPKMAISKLVNSLKGASSRVLRKQNYPSIQKALWGESLWSRSYFAGSCGGASVDMIRKYIENETTPV